MDAKHLSAKLDSADALAAHLQALLALDARLSAVAEKAGPFELRVTEPGFAGMARVICGQQLSVASARAIWGRFAAIEGALQPHTYLQLPEPAIRAAGMSAGKYRTIRTIAEAMVAGDLDFDHAESLPPAEAVAYLSRHKGIGPWTAEIYLMFCAGHPDIFPGGDLALQKAVGHALDLAQRPTARELMEIAEVWSPHRATAALLFWRYFAAIRDKEGIAL